MFSEGSLSEFLSQRKSRMLAELDAADGENLLTHVPETLAHGIAQRFTLKPIELAASEKRVDVSEIRVDARYVPDRFVSDQSRPVWIDGTQITLSVPFSGSPELLAFRPGTWDGAPPRGNAVGSELVFVQSWPDTPANRDVEQWVANCLRDVEKYVGWQADDLAKFNPSLEPAAAEKINRRRGSLLAKRNLQASLPFNMTSRPEAPLTFTPEGVRRSPVSFPPNAAGHPAFAPEAALSPQQFDDILRTLRAIGNSMERTPGTFSKLEEEELRSVFLAALNAQFEGGATGETFNAEGKTDILIRHDDRNLFIGECKIWQGPAALNEAIDQVLGYACWRDSHAAVLLFVRNKDMSAVVEKIPPAVTAHRNFLRQVGERAPSEWHFKFRQKDDSSRELSLAVQAYHVRP
jgi:hypothetical protein